MNRGITFWFIKTGCNTHKNHVHLCLVDVNEVSILILLLHWAEVKFDRKLLSLGWRVFRVRLVRSVIGCLSHCCN